MTTETGLFVVKSASAPTVNVDPEAAAVYVRFKRAKIARTVARPSRSFHLAVDLDAKGEVVGVEAVGITEFSLAGLLARAAVKAPKADLGAAIFRQAPAIA